MVGECRARSPDPLHFRRPLMRWFLFACGIALVTSPVAAAPKPDAQEVTKLKLEVAGIEILIAKKNAELAKARAIGAEGLKIREACRAQVVALRDALDGVLVAPQARAKKAKAAANKAAGEEATARRALEDAQRKLKATTDADEVADLKKEVALLEATLAEKKKKATTAQAEANAADAELTKAVDASKLLLKLATDDADKVISEAQKREAEAAKAVTECIEALDRAAVKLQKAQQQLKALGK